MKNCLIIILSIFMLSSAAYCVDLTSEIVLSAFNAEKLDMSSDLYGTVFANLYASDSAQADLHCQFGKDRNKINVGYVKFFQGKVDVIIGRQLMAWGSGYNFNPTDVFNTKPIGASFDPSYYKSGRDALVVTSYYFGVITDFVGAADYSSTQKTSDMGTLEETGNQDFGVRVKKNISDFDAAVSFVNKGKRDYTGVEEAEDNVLGFSIKGSIPRLDWGVWVESAVYNEQKISETSIGIEYIFSDYTVILEYYQNGFGSKNKENYNFDLLFQGRSMGRDYFAPSISAVPNEKFTFTGFAFLNLNDSSSIVGGVIDYFYNDNIEIALLPFYVSGNQDSEYGFQQDSIGNLGLQGLIKVTF